MDEARSDRKETTASALKTPEDFRTLSRRILHRANRNAPRVDFVEEVSLMLMKFSGCDLLELWLKEEQGYFRCREVLCLAGCYHFQVLPALEFGQRPETASSGMEMKLTQLGWDLIRGRFNASVPGFTSKGSFWTGDLAESFLATMEAGSSRSPAVDDYKSLMLLPLNISHMNIGLLQLRSRREKFFIQSEAELYEDVVDIMAVTLLNQRARAACRERVKELTCLYGILKAAEQPDASLDQVMKAVVELLPPAWQYPEIARARIILDGKTYASQGFWDGQLKQAADILVSDRKRGVVEVVYLENKPELDEGPFLKEERTLINNVARQMAIIADRYSAEQTQERLEGQLRHADRLATIGQLAAGVAHELNEPLGNILGFAQLAQKNTNLSPQARQDIGKIVTASLYAREIVNKLKLFARQTPLQKEPLDLNQLVQEGLVFLGARCAKSGIEMIKTLAPDLPKIIADRGQIHQVLVNLVVNAIQAMPKGGRLTIRTIAERDDVSLSVEDTGVGMTPEVMHKIFQPFFTTKDVSEGTGLGLAVVDGIVSSHNGKIHVESRLGQGSRFTIRLPIQESDHQEDY